MSTATTLGHDEKAFDYIAKMVGEMSAIVIDKQKAYLVESRLAPLMRKHGFEALEDLVAELGKRGVLSLKQEVVEAMTTNETSFYRDIHPFQALKGTILPELIERRRSERKLTIWSNACSSGQEPYTLAMILKEHFPELEGWKIELIGSDLDTTILERAKTGDFNQTEVNRGLPMQLLLRYFERHGLFWQIKKEIRDMVSFRQLNLVDPIPSSMPPMDIVFLRNVLIYFSVETKQSILAKTRRLLRDDGYLFLGGGESIMNMDVNFERSQIGKAVCYRPT